jgi:hypothetical protein
MFKATCIQQPKDQKIGSWDELCDLDKRVWRLTPYMVDKNGEELLPIKEPLVTIKAKVTKSETRIIDIYTLEDLNGFYLGGDNSK